MYKILEMFTTFGASAPAACDPNKTFLGIPVWYKYLDIGSPVKNAQCDFSNFQGSDFLLIGLALIDALIRVAALVAVGYVIYGGVKYAISQGSPDKTQEARQTIINALVGLVIAITAAALVNFVGRSIAT